MPRQRERATHFVPAMAARARTSATPWGPAFSVAADSFAVGTLTQIRSPAALLSDAFCPVGTFTF